MIRIRWNPGWLFHYHVDVRNEIIFMLFYVRLWDISIGYSSTFMEHDEGLDTIRRFIN